MLYSALLFTTLYCSWRLPFV